MGGERQQSSLPIRISLQYMNDNISAGALSRLQSNNGPIRSAVTFFQSFLSVNRFTKNLRAPPTCRIPVDLTECVTNDLVPPMCGPHVRIPADHTAALLTCSNNNNCAPLRGNDGVGVADSDYVLYITSIQDGNMVIATKFIK